MQINSDSEIDLDVTKSVINDNFKQVNNTDEMVDECVKEIDEIQNFTLDKFGLRCSMKMAQFAYCMWRKFTLNCPPEKQQKNKQCNKLRIVLRKNNDDKN